MGLHASPSRWHQKVLPRVLPAAKRHWTSAVVVTAVVAASSAGAWAMTAGDEPPPVTAGAALSAASRTIPSPFTARTTNDAINTANRFGSAAPRLSAPPSAPAPVRETKAADAKRSPEKEAATAAATAPEKPSEPKKAEKKRSTQRKVISSGRCGASFYDEGQMTANGERFDPNAMTAAHKTLPMGSKVRVTNPRNGRVVTVRINDRGPFIAGRCLDLSRAAFNAIGSLSTGAMTVKYDVFAK
ncbi:hypothetical protein GCM10022226_30170 [Sphaerisporangium flaviroseum]|uniref:Probable endolytic peptidoglycan transglycosylase RlpA n=1 Tax=Sphaerisporangium flaviroseum TaxID=509199 RepID=A0ABP7I2M3_9ACTN